eukprot:TRINITY_DN81341_c0_g1_i1.p1 TRINITY_DN81341_c0_g1~~TRINITY_DN81341_c0_g1_i1.p1  ORF type:complete len:284 (+),score=27.13 TRINITY_DN81341_c0_g1_i1:64-915(+)
MAEISHFQDLSYELPPQCLVDVIRCIGVTSALGHVAAACSSWKAVAMSESTSQALAEARYGVDAAAHGKQSYPTWRHLLVDDNGCGGFWVLDISSTAGWKYNSPACFYINGVRWIGLQRLREGGARLVVLVDALGERDLRNAHETTLIVRYGSDDETVSKAAVAHTYISRTRCRHVCALEYEVSEDLARATELHWVYNGDMGRGLAGSDYRAGCILRSTGSSPMLQMLERCATALPQGCEARRFQLAPITYHGLEQAATLELLSSWQVPPDIMQKYHQRLWGS